MKEETGTASGVERPSTETHDVRRDTLRWRKAERQRLIEHRMSLPSDFRQRASKQIARALLDVVGNLEGRTVSGYWPFRGEPDLREVLEAAWSGGGRAALPIVVEKGHPLLFRAWKTGDPLEKGVWNIPVPSEGPEVVPDVVIAPVVGFDAGCFRLGYGGGFFDRTLARLGSGPTVIGVGYDCQRIPTIRPLSHDIPMDMVITETGIVRAAG